MKTYLYGTTAVAAVGLLAGQASAAEPIHMELGGFYNQYFGFLDQDLPANSNDASSVQNAEVFFTMVGELDNGLKVGGRIELEGTQSGDQIDQAYLTLSGGFGSLRIGAINSGRYSYGWNTDSPQVGLPINSGWVSSFVTPLNNSGLRFRSPALSTVIDASNDDQKLTYFTPRFSGFQFTVSWTPNAHDASNTSPSLNGGESTGPHTEGLIYSNAFDLGVSYSGEFNGIGVEFQGGYGTATAATVPEALGFDDYNAFNGGLGVSYQGLSVAGSFAVVTDGLALSCTTTPTPACPASNEGQAFSAGVGYSTGPYGVSAAYFQGEEDGLTNVPVGGVDGGDETNTFFTVAGSYDLGGVTASLTYLHAEYEGDNLSSPGGVNDNEGDAVIVGVHLGF